MESFIFNNFKDRLMNGDVNAKENWFFYPVNKSFVKDFEDKIKYIKHTNDFRLFLPDDKMWLDDAKALSEYQQLTAEGLEYIEFKSRHDKSDSGSGGGSCCTIM